MQTKGLKLKICGMRETENCSEVASLRPDFMGFIFYSRSSRFVDDMPAKLTGTLRDSGIEPVAVFVNESTDKILEVVRDFGFSHIQLHGDESPEICLKLKSEGLKVIKVFSIAETRDLDSTINYAGTCDLFLFDTRTPDFGGSGKSFDWTLLNEYTGETSFLLSGGIGPEDAERISAFKHPRLAGIDVNSRFESKPGLKDITLLQSFIQQLNK